MNTNPPPDDVDERWLRTDLCLTCMEEDHEMCWTLNEPSPDCSCCLATLAALEEENV